ncbi:hypothetical protein NYA30BAC_03592 [Halomonas sp. NYA30]
MPKRSASFRRNHAGNFVGPFEITFTDELVQLATSRFGYPH